MKKDYIKSHGHYFMTGPVVNVHYRGASPGREGVGRSGSSLKNLGRDRGLS